MLSRSRGKGEGILRVTGRDVIEADYAVKFCDGAWSLDGATLAEARANVTAAAPRRQSLLRPVGRDHRVHPRAAIWR